MPGLSGVAGEYFVAAELSKRGHIASITLKNTRGIDILASNIEATRQVVIQVKTNRDEKLQWLLYETAEDYYADNLFYVFVNLKGEGERPDYYIVPSKTVAEYAKTEHQEWLATPGRHGQQRNETTMRVFRVQDNTYLENWNLLGL